MRRLAGLRTRPGAVATTGSSSSLGNRGRGRSRVPCLAERRRCRRSPARPARRLTTKPTLRLAACGWTAAAGPGPSWSALSRAGFAVAPALRPAGFDPRSASDPRYNFSGLDAILRDAVDAGFEVVPSVRGAPSWAEGPNRPLNAAPGTWKPDPAAFGDFMHALATRYSGDFPDPANPGTALPRVRYFKVWNEPNLATYLRPQWSGNQPASPDHYRTLVNAAYAGVKSAGAAQQIVAGGLAPYGDEPGEDRMRPITFLERFFCLRPGGGGRADGCASPARFDILSHHPINQFGPRNHAGNPLDVTTPGPRSDRACANARPAREHDSTGGAKPLWVSEFWWASNPPSIFGVSPEQHARWLQEALYLFWKQGVSVAMWLQVRDPAPAGTPWAPGSTTRTGRRNPRCRPFASRSSPIRSESGERRGGADPADPRLGDRPSARGRSDSAQAPRRLANREAIAPIPGRCLHQRGSGAERSHDARAAGIGRDEPAMEAALMRGTSWREPAHGARVLPYSSGRSLRNSQLMGEGELAHGW